MKRFEPADAPLRLVNPEVAREIAHWFQAAPTRGGKPRQSRLYRGLARWAAVTELHAEHSVTWTTRQFPEHKAVLLPRRLFLRCVQPGLLALAG